MLNQSILKIILWVLLYGRVSCNRKFRLENGKARCGKCRVYRLLYCYLCCPEGVIFKKGKAVDIDYAFCKGCGICARVCPKKAIKMVREEKNHGR